MRLPVRALVAATALAIPVASAHPCIYWYPDVVYPGVVMPVPTQIWLNC